MEGDDELKDEKEADTSTKIARLAVETSKNVDGSLTKRDDESKELLGTAEESTVLLEGEVDLDEVGTGEELHDHTGGNDGRDTEFHESTTVGSENDTHPVERVGEDLHTFVS